MSAPLLRKCIERAATLLSDHHESLTLAKSAELVQAESAPATHVFAATKVLLGEIFIAWEPESVWLGLQDKGLEIPDVNRDKILAVGTLLLVPAFYWDANLFEDTCLAFNDEPVIVNAVQEASPAQIAWGVFEAQTILMANGESSHQFDHEPRQYTAAVLHHNGYVLAPALLAFCQDELDSMNTTDDAFYSEVLSRWSEIQRNSTPLIDLELQETPLDTQMAKMAAVELYIDARAERYL